jgi:hypothetical protein
LYEG